MQLRSIQTYTGMYVRCLYFTFDIEQAKGFNSYIRILCGSNNFLCSFLLFRKRDSIRVIVFCMDQITFFCVDQIILRSFLWRTFRHQFKKNTVKFRAFLVLSCHRSLQRYYFLDLLLAKNLKYLFIHKRRR